MSEDYSNLYLIKISQMEHERLQFQQKIRDLEKDKLELIESLENTNLAMSKLVEIHSCFDLEKSLMPVYSKNVKIIEKYKGD